MDLGLERIEKLVHLLGNPEKQFKAIHIAGTNGKGSTTLMIASILKHSLKVGTFTSPFLIAERDSIKIQGISVDEHSFDQCKRNVLEVASSLKPTSFEVLTAVAFLVFAQQKIDIAVIEVGMGGSLDSTNVIPPPIISAICKIGLDHTDFLGNNIRDIASQKAGIIKSGTIHCVIGLQQYEDATDVIIKKAKQESVPYHIIKSKAVLLCSDPYTVEVFIEGLGKLSIQPSMQGGYQLENIATACQVISQMRQIGYQITESQIKSGLETARNPGRLEWVDTPYGKICVDGAHNVDGIEALAEYAKSLRKFPSKGIAFIVGFSGQKDVALFLRTLCQENDIVYPVEFSPPPGMPWIRAMDSKLIESASMFCVNCNGSISEALEMIQREKTPTVILCGSLYLIAEFYRQFNIF
jgi:folylpolyglutamate synthase/dihydrofolate synthase